MCPLLAQELGNVLSFAWPQLSSFRVGTCILSAPQMDVCAQAGAHRPSLPLHPGPWGSSWQVLAENFVWGVLHPRSLYSNHFGVRFWRKRDTRNNLEKVKVEERGEGKGTA